MSSKTRKAKQSTICPLKSVVLIGAIVRGKTSIGRDDNSYERDLQYVGRPDGVWRKTVAGSALRLTLRRHVLVRVLAYLAKVRWQSLKSGAGTAPTLSEPKLLSSQHRCDSGCAEFAFRLDCMRKDEDAGTLPITQGNMPPPFCPKPSLMSPYFCRLPSRIPVDYYLAIAGV